MVITINYKSQGGGGTIPDVSTHLFIIVKIKPNLFLEK